MKRLSIAVSLALLMAGCGDSKTTSTPIAPSPPPAPLLPQSLHGYVADSSFRAMAGVRVQVLSGPETGMELTSGVDGAFTYTGTFPGTVSIRASKEGYVPTTQPVRLAGGMAWVFFALAPLAPPVQVAGDYTLTITADRGCAGFPDDVLTRTFTASVKPGTNTSAPPNTYFNGTVSGAQFAPFANIFWVGVAGDYVAVSTEGEGPSIVEQVGPNRYVAYWGSAGASLGSQAASTLSASFNGTIEYCELKAAIGMYYDCSPAVAAVHEQCTSQNNQLTLTRR